MRLNDINDVVSKLNEIDEIKYVVNFCSLLVCSGNLHNLWHEQIFLAERDEIKQ
jgi:hypothetical protein